MGAPGFVFTAIARPRSGRGNLLPKNGIAIKGDSQKVNCPNGAREATLGCAAGENILIFIRRLCGELCEAFLTVCGGPYGPPNIFSIA